MILLTLLLFNIKLSSLCIGNISHYIYTMCTSRQNTKCKHKYVITIVPIHCFYAKQNHILLQCNIYVV